jgi:hypothetical protein
VNLVVSSGPPTAPTVVVALDGAPVVTSTAQGWQVVVTLQNTGNTTATTVSETSAALGGIAATDIATPISALAPGAVGTLTITFPATAGAAGSSVRFSLSGSYTGTGSSGNWSVSLRSVALP